MMMMDDYGTIMIVITEMIKEIKETLDLLLSF